MKKYFLYIFTLVVLSGGLLTSCEDIFGDYLDKQPSNELTEEEVFNSWENTKAFYYDIYNFLRNGLGRINYSWMDSATDLAETSYSWGGTRTSFNIGNYYASSGANELTDTWSHYYRGIRKCNMLLERIDGVPSDPAQTEADRQRESKRIKSETRVLRAYFYWELTLRYGAIPVITSSLDPLDDNAVNIPRPASVKPCIQFVLKELDESYYDLQDDVQSESDPSHITANDVGRITRGINLALQSRIKLYMASPRFADLGIATWADAVDAAKIFMDYYGEGVRYELFTSTDAPMGYQLAINRRVFDGNKEVIFWRNDNSGDWWKNESPIGFGGNGGLCPSQNLVDMYDMASGLSPFQTYDETGAPVYDANGTPAINAASGYDDQDPYTDRDPRMYKTVLYNGAMWWNRAIDTSVGGTDNPNGNANATPTSYYNRKYLDDSQTHYLNGGLMYRNWIFIRYAEILLNYAEALNEQSGPTNEVFNTLQKLRDRVGMTALLSDRAELKNKDTMRNFIRKERTIELAFEDHRSWDVRRWNKAKEALSRPIYGMQITKNGAQLVYTRKKVQDRVFSDKMYLYPVPEEEIWKTGMDNNPGW